MDRSSVYTQLLCVTAIALRALVTCAQVFTNLFVSSRSPTLPVRPIVSMEAPFSADATFRAASCVLPSAEVHKSPHRVIIEFMGFDQIVRVQQPSPLMPSSDVKIALQDGAVRQLQFGKQSNAHDFVQKLKPMLAENATDAPAPRSATQTLLGGPSTFQDRDMPAPTEVVEVMGSSNIHLTVKCALKNFFFLNHGTLYIGDPGLVFATTTERILVRFVDIATVSVSSGEGLALLDGIGVYVTTTYGTRYHFTEMSLSCANEVASILRSKAQSLYNTK
mmetsp:Transcript_11234/g.31845  ORF Transcript_11234/g.31845 Transcript_11234/m.31845 type:complete len:277 (-) Transcript_11234:117-947(-)